MSIERLRDYLEHLDALSLPFSAEELNEPLLTVYNLIEGAVRDQCTVIEISPRQVAWRKQINEENVGIFSTPVSFREYFQLAIDRDPMIREHMQVFEETDVATVCLID